MKKTILSLVFSFSSIEEMLDVYYKTGALALDLELQFFRQLAASDSADEYTKAEALLTGSHQRYLNFAQAQRFKKEAIERLANAQLWDGAFDDFENLHATVCDVLKEIPYIKDLAKYDVAKRLGVMLSSEILPKKYVYIQNGTRSGASAVLGEPIDKTTYRLSKERFAPFFGDMPAVHIENILCIMKDYFVAGGIAPCENKEFKPCCFNYDKWLLTIKK